MKRRADQLQPGDWIHTDDGIVIVRGVTVFSDPFVGGDAATIVGGDERGNKVTLPPVVAATQIDVAAPEPEATHDDAARSEVLPSITENRTASCTNTIADNPPWAPVGSVEIAGMLDVAEQTVRAWKIRKRMPEPDWYVGGRPLWRSDRIEAWARQTGRAAA